MAILTPSASVAPDIGCPIVPATIFELDELVKVALNKARREHSLEMMMDPRPMHRIHVTQQLKVKRDLIVQWFEFHHKRIMQQNGL